MDRTISLINDDLMNLSTEMEGLRWMIYAVSQDINFSADKASEKEKLDRIEVTFPTIISTLDNYIRRLDDITNEIDVFDLHRSDNLPGTTLKAEMLQGECDEVMEGRCKA